MRLNGFAFLWALLTARVAAALEPVTVAISIAAVSALSGYLTYSDFFSCRFSECCKEDRPLNVSGTCPRAARGGRAGGRREFGSTCSPKRRRGRQARHTFADLSMTGGRTELNAAAPAVRASVAVRQACTSIQKARLWLFRSSRAGRGGGKASSELSREMALPWMNESAWLPCQTLKC